MRIGNNIKSANLSLIIKRRHYKKSIGEVIALNIRILTILAKQNLSVILVEVL